jgi:hypothetical protein
MALLTPVHSKLRALGMHRPEFFKVAKPIPVFRFAIPAAGFAGVVE